MIFGFLQTYFWLVLKPIWTPYPAIVILSKKYQIVNDIFGSFVEWAWEDSPSLRLGPRALHTESS